MEFHLLFYFLILDQRARTCRRGRSGELPQSPFALGHRDREGNPSALRQHLILGVIKLRKNILEAKKKSGERSKVDIVISMGWWWRADRVWKPWRFPRASKDNSRTLDSTFLSAEPSEKEWLFYVFFNSPLPTAETFLGRAPDSEVPFLFVYLVVEARVLQLTPTPEPRRWPIGRRSIFTAHPVGDPNKSFLDYEDRFATPTISKRGRQNREKGFSRAHVNFFEFFKFIITGPITRRWSPSLLFFLCIFISNFRQLTQDRETSYVQNHYKLPKIENKTKYKNI